MRIVLIGAYGYTGKLICEEFKNHSIKFSIAGKNERELVALQSSNSQIENYYVSDLRKPKDIEALLGCVDLIINCAGPFTEESSLFLEKVSVSGKNYLDITGEVGFVKKSKEIFHSKAIESNSLIVHSVAFESMITDLILQIIPMKEEKPVIKIYYRFNQKEFLPVQELQ